MTAINGSWRPGRGTKYQDTMMEHRRTDGAMVGNVRPQARRTKTVKRLRNINDSGQHRGEKDGNQSTSFKRNVVYAG